MHFCCARPRRRWFSTLLFARLICDSSIDGFFSEEILKAHLNPPSKATEPLLTCGSSPRVSILIFDQNVQEAVDLQRSFSAADGFDVVGVYSVVNDAIHAIRVFRPVIAVVSLDHPGEAIAVVSQVVAEHLPTRFVYLCSSGFAELVTSGETIVSRSEATAVLPNYVRDLLQASGFQTPIQGIEKAAQGSGPTSVLTARERHIKSLVIQGLSNKDIARSLKLAEGTVKVHVHNILRKLSASNRRALMVRRDQADQHSQKRT